MTFYVDMGNFTTHMTVKCQLNLGAFLADHPVFSLGELAAARGRPGDGRAAHNQLKHHLRRGRVKNVARGIYAAVPPGIDPRGFSPDRYLVGAAARPDGVFAYHAALELLGSAHSVWHECTLHTRRARTPVDVGHARVLFLPTPQPLRRLGLHELAIRDVPHETQHLRVTSSERTLVEGFRQPHRVGGLSELVESAAGFAVLDFDVLEAVLVAYDQRSLWAAIGWFVERHGEQWLPPAEFLSRCRRQRPRSNQYLLRDRRGGTALPAWHLIVPTELVRGFEGHASDS